MKRITALLLALTLVLSMLSGCKDAADSAAPSAGTNEAKTASVSEAAPASHTPAPTELQSSDSTPEAASVLEEPTASFVDVELPLAETPENLSLWVAVKPFLMAYNLDVSQLTFYQEMEKRTGVSTAISSVAIFAANEAFNLMIASGDYPDMIDSFQVLYTGSADSAIEQNIIVDLMDYMEYMPNYQAALDMDRAFWMDSLTIEGALPSANMLFASSEGATIGFMIREDWLKDANLDVPVTYDDMEQVLAAFKRDHGVAALGLNGYGQGWGVEAGMGVRDLDVSDTSKAAFLCKDGMVTFSPATPEYREYLELVSDWYAKGYVWTDFVSQANSAYQSMASGVIGVTTTERDLAQTITDMLQVDDPDAGFIGIRALRKDPAEKLHISYFIEKIIYGTAISATSEKKELVARWLDYCYSPEGQILTNYGVEGEGLQYDADGNPCYTELVLHSQDYGVTAATAIYSQYGGAMLCYGDRALEGYTPRVQEAIENWAYDDQDWMYPTKVTMTTEQGEEYTAIINDINNYATEMTLKFITGEVALNDSTWQEYMDTVENMGLERAVAIKQTALDAYLSKA